MFQETPESLFWMADDTVRQELEVALQDSHPSHVHPRVSEELKGPSMYFDIMSLADARRYLHMQISKYSDVNFFADADLDTMVSYRVTNAVNILRCFTRYSALVIEKMKKKLMAQEKIDLMAERVKFHYLFKSITMNGDFVQPLNYKSFIYGLLGLMKQGYLFALVMFCELCLDFCSADCYPKFNLIQGTVAGAADTLTDTGKVNERSVCNQIVFRDSFWHELFKKHAPTVLFVLLNQQ
jgi:hypothetical protein